MGDHPQGPLPSDEFERKAGQRDSGPVRSLFGFMRENKKWWLLPIVISLLFLWILVVVGGSSLAPFIYALF